LSKFIVITTINKPTEATLKFSNKKDWQLIVVGDKKTPHEYYRQLNCIYLDPEAQQDLYPRLSDSIGWNTIQRRNIGLLHAFNLGAEIIATVDDDNIPYDDWGDNLLIGKEIECDLYETANAAFDPLSVTNNNHLWHRGYPIELVPTRHNVNYKGKTKRKVLIQADLWDGDPDIDALARLCFMPTVKYDIQKPFCSNTISPFNSQNTFLAREVIPLYSVLPFIGRMDDIWGGYILQYYFPQSLVYNKASVYQDRNKQDLITNLENEIIGYRNTLKLLEDLSNFHKYLPEKTLNYYSTYKEMFS
jgi:hypothetical protein